MTVERTFLGRTRTVFDLLASMIAVFIGLTVFSLAVWWLVLDAAPPIRSLEGDHAVTPKVAPGGELLVSRNFCVDKVPICTVGRTINNSKAQSLPQVDAPTKLGCFRDQVHSVEIPGTTESGRHTYRETIRCAVNPAVTAVIQMPDIHFDVVYELPRRSKR